MRGDPGLLFRLDKTLRHRDKRDAVKFLKDENERVSQDEKIEEITALLKASGMVFTETPELKFIKQDAWDGTQMRLRRLAFNPDGLTNRIPSYPWAGSKGVNAIKREITRFAVPHWAQDYKDMMVNSISIPCTTGMIRSDGSMNKDLEQLTVNTGSIQWDKIPGLRGAYSRAMDRLVEEFLSWNGKRVKLSIWEKDTFAYEMRKAIKSSTPGYPFNGYGWLDDLGDRTCFDEVYRLGEERILKQQKDPFIFFQGSRYTGDGGESDGLADGEGKQRLVQAAPACEKLVGHILAKPLKAFFKSHPSSGQLGIDEVTKSVKKLAQGKRKPYMGDVPIRAWTSCDISRWDSAQTDEFVRDGFFEFYSRISDTEDELTQTILGTYQEGYFGRVLMTAMGALQPNFLPSGASVTTVVAFVNHFLILYTIDELVKESHGSVCFAEFGLQGDDQISALQFWDNQIESTIREVYSAFNCVVKGDLRVRLNDDPDCTVVFLNEVIHLHDDQPNVRFPKWNYYFSESIEDLHRGVNIDRMLLDEILERVPHASPIELLFASWVSKMDRMKHMPFYQQMLRKSITAAESKNFYMRSWLGSRVLPTSHTIEELRKYEAEKGIEYPGDLQAAYDRQEHQWLSAEEVGELAALFWICAKDPSALQEVRKVIRNSRSYVKAFRRTRGAIDKVGMPRTRSEEKGHKELRQLVSKAFEAGYKDVAKQLADLRSELAVDTAELSRRIAALNDAEISTPVKNTGEPVMQSTLARAVLAYNEVNPFELLKHASKSARMLYNSPSWSQLTPSEQEFVLATYQSLFHCTIEGQPLSDLDHESSSEAN